VGRDSSVCIETDYSLDNPRSDGCGDKIFRFYLMGNIFLPRGKAAGALR